MSTNAPAPARPEPLVGAPALVAGVLEHWLDGRIDDTHLLPHLVVVAGGTLAVHPETATAVWVLTERLRDGWGELPPSDTACDRCRPVELCAFHRAQLYAWHDYRDPIARDVHTALVGRHA